MSQPGSPRSLHSICIEAELRRDGDLLELVFDTKTHDQLCLLGLAEQAVRVIIQSGPLAYAGAAIFCYNIVEGEGFVLLGHILPQKWNTPLVSYRPPSATPALQEFTSGPVTIHARPYHQNEPRQPTQPPTRGA